MKTFLKNNVQPEILRDVFSDNLNECLRCDLYDL
jgi:hypothetical protein